MNTVLITGANRGIGLEFCYQYGQQGWKVIACCRQPEQATELNKLAEHMSLQIHEMDVMNRNGIDALANELQHVSIDLLIANAGVYGEKPGHALGNLAYTDWADTLETNVLGVVKVVEAFLPHLRRSEMARIVALSSQMGSIEDNSSGGNLLYRSSKAALNAVMKSIAIDLTAEQIGVLIFHPGWVKTDMGGVNALIDAKTSVAGMVRQIQRFTMPQTGQFIKYDGTQLPW